MVVVLVYVFGGDVGIVGVNVGCNVGGGTGGISGGVVAFVGAAMGTLHNRALPPGETAIRLDIFLQCHGKPLRTSE